MKKYIQLPNGMFVKAENGTHVASRYCYKESYVLRHKYEKQCYELSKIFSGTSVGTHYSFKWFSNCFE